MLNIPNQKNATSLCVVKSIYTHITQSYSSMNAEKLRTEKRNKKKT